MKVKGKVERVGGRRIYSLYSAPPSRFTIATRARRNNTRLDLFQICRKCRKYRNRCRPLDLFLP